MGVLLQYTLSHILSTYRKLWDFKFRGICVLSVCGWLFEPRSEALFL